MECFHTSVFVDSLQTELSWRKSCIFYHLLTSRHHRWLKPFLMEHIKTRTRFSSTLSCDFQFLTVISDHLRVISDVFVMLSQEKQQIWGIWKLRPAYSPETPNLGQNQWCFVPCDLEIWWMTLENNRASLLCCFKLCATFHNHRWIRTGVTVRKRRIWVKFEDF